MKFKVVGILMLFCWIESSKAETNHVRARQVYIGQEVYKGSATGQTCFVSVQDVTPFSDKGLHCYSIEFQLNSIRSDLPKEILKVDSRVTNYHRPEFPKLRTCAMNIDGTTSGNEIYDHETTNLYNQIFSGSHSSEGIRYDYFLTLSPDQKKITRSRFHIMKTFSEYDVDCVKMELM